jgi:hypothetical protein
MNSFMPTICKKERRKVSHSVIEKKRRERINYCINQLNLLVPSCQTEDNLQKLAVLEKTVEYVRRIQGIQAEDKKYPLSPASLEEEENLPIMSISNILN